jgi:argininosuccinate lyase
MRNRNHLKELVELRSWLRKLQDQGLLEQTHVESIVAALAQLEHAVRVGDRKRTTKAITSVSKALLKCQL